MDECDALKTELAAVKADLEGFKASYHKLQAGWDAEIQAHADTRAAHDATVKDIKTAHAMALLKEKQRVDRLEFEARQAAELASVGTQE